MNAVHFGLFLPMKILRFISHLRRPPSRRRSAFTLLELLATVATITLLAVLLVPGIKNMTAKSQGARCLANLRQIGVGVAAYTGENNGAFPRGGWSDGGSIPLDPPGIDGIGWLADIYPYVGESRKVFVCPAGKEESPTGTTPWIRMPGGSSSDPKYPSHYAYNAHLNTIRSNLRANTSLPAYVDRVAGVKNLSGLPVVIDIVFQNNFLGDYPAFEANPSETASQIFAVRHGSVGNVLWGDGSVSSMTFDQWVNAPAERITSGGWKNYRFCTGNY